MYNRVIPDFVGITPDTFNSKWQYNYSVSLWPNLHIHTIRSSASITLNCQLFMSFHINRPSSFFNWFFIVKKLFKVILLSGGHSQRLHFTCTKRASYFKIFWRSPAVYILATLGLTWSASLLHDGLIILHFLPLGDGPKVHCSHHKSSFGSGPYFIRNGLSAVGLTAGANSYSVWVWMSQSGPEYF